MPHNIGHVAFVLNLFDTGLGAVRSLARAGIRVVGLDFDPANAGFASRHCVAKRCPDPVHQAEELLRLLLAEGQKLDPPEILFALALRMQSVGQREVYYTAACQIRAMAATRSRCANTSLA